MPRTGNYPNPSLQREQDLREKRRADAKRRQRGSVYKPGHVRNALNNLPQLREAILYGCAPDAEEEQVGKRDHHTGEGFRAELVCLVADIEMSIGCLPGPEGCGIMHRLADVAEMIWREQRTQHEVAECVGCSQRHVSRKIDIAEGRIIGRLCVG